MRLLWCRYTPVRPPQGLRLIQIPLHQRHEQRRRQPHQGHGQPAQSALHGAYLDGARRSDAVCGGSQRKSPRFGVPHPAAAQNPLAEDTAEDSDAEDHDRRDRHDAAQRSRHGDGDRHGDRFGGYRGEDFAPCAERHGDIDDAQHARHASREGCDAHRQQTAAQLFHLFVKQVSQRHDRHAQREIERRSRLLVAGIVDARRAEEDDHRDERQQYGMQQRHPQPSVDGAAQAVESYGERQQEEVRGEESLVNHGRERLERFRADAGCAAGANGGSGFGRSAP